jgi:hypothetical protein
MESQRHGFDIENYIKTHVFRVEKVYAYNSIHDVRNEDNPYDTSENISIKASTGKTQTVCFGSPLRIFNYPDNEKHTAIIVFLEQRGEQKYVTGVAEMSLDDKHTLFGDVTEADIRELDALIRSVPKDQKPAELIRQIHAAKTNLNKKSGIIKFNPKIDSKSQRRLQCSIPSFYKMKDTVIVRSFTKDAVVRGINLPASFLSASRTRTNNAV